MSYDPRKAAQTIAYLTVKNGRRPLNVIMAVKLVYLADRESVRCHGFPIQDEDYSMPHGLVNTMTYQFIKGEIHPDQTKGWSEFLKDCANHCIGLSDPAIDPNDLDELSEADIAILDAGLGPIWWHGPLATQRLDT